MAKHLTQLTQERARMMVDCKSGRNQAGKRPIGLMYAFVAKTMPFRATKAALHAPWKKWAKSVKESKRYPKLQIV